MLYLANVPIPDPSPKQYAALNPTMTLFPASFVLPATAHAPIITFLLVVLLKKFFIAS